MRLYFCFLISFFCVFTCLIAQNIEQNKDYIAAKHQVNKSKISIRWVPSSLDLWLCSQTSGYLIQRIELSKNEIADSTSFANAKSITASLAGKPFEKNDPRWNELIKKDSAVKMVYDYRFNLSTVEKKSDEMKFAFNYIQLSADLSMNSAIVQGIIYQDSTYSKKKKYGYKISIIDCNIKYKPAYLTVDPGKDELKIPEIKIKGKSENKLANISWDANLLRNNFSYYNIEKSEDSTKFYAINKKPILFLYNSASEKKEYVYTDSLQTNHKKYFYRIYGIDIFGNKSNYSNIVSIIGKGFTTQCPVIDSAYLDLKGKTRLAGHFISKKGFDELKQIALSRKNNSTNPQQSISNLTNDYFKFSFIDEKPNLSNYYQVVLINRSNDSLVCPSVFIAGIDSTPPSMPTDISGSIDKNGIVNLIWKKNEEKDILGYRVFTKNALNEELKEATHFLLNEPIYTDTIEIKTLTKKIYYSVVAVDQMYNKSKYSTVIEVKRPDIIAPSAPIFKQISVSDSSIHINWVNSYSNDVSNTQLFAMHPDSTNIVLLKEWNLSDTSTSFKFTKGESGKNYLFMLLCADSSNNFSYTRSHIINYKTYHIKAIQINYFKVNHEKNCIELTWQDANNIKKVFSYELYKNKTGEKPILYKTTTAFSFTDYEVAINNSYEYSIKAIFNDGSETPLSTPLKIEY